MNDEETKLSSVETTDLTEIDASKEAPEGETPAPIPDKVFGMTRRCFHFTAFGLASGYIIGGLLGLAGLHLPITGTVIVMGIIGWYIGGRLEKRDAAKAAAETKPEDEK